MNTNATGPDDDPGKAREAAAQSGTQAGDQAGIQETTPEAAPATAPEKAPEKAREDNAAHPLVGRAKPAKRERIVLAKRRNSRRVVRTLAELEDQTSVGEALVRQLVRVQLVLSIRLMLLTVVVLGSMPLAFLLVPSLGTITIVSLRLPWLLLGFAIYPFFVAVAWCYNRSADRHEQGFAEMAES
jgi:hypothetical protein